jgi:hypothetical protein
MLIWKADHAGLAQATPNAIATTARTLIFLFIKLLNRVVGGRHAPASRILADFRFENPPQFHAPGDGNGS